MAIKALGQPKGALPAVWTLAFRPFFFGAASWSAAALLLWVAMLVRGEALGSRFNPLSWHIHEMLFGFVLAAIAGFMLTAIPNWTGRPPIRGGALASLAGLWLLGRVACLTSAWWPFSLAVAADLAFPLALFAVALREIVAARNWRNLPMPAPIAALGVADLLMHLESAGFGVPQGLGWRLGVAAVIVLISVVGGRIIPAFTRNWLAKRGEARLPVLKGLVDRAALGTLHAGLVLWAFLPASRPIGGLLLLAAALNVWRLSRWRGAATRTEPLLWVLHLGYLWVPVGAGLLGASMSTNAVPVAAAVHALTAGAIGTMVLAVMTRVSLGHTGRPLAADRTTAAIYLLINAAAIVRITAEIVGGGSFLRLIELSGALWAGSYALFVIWYGPILLMPRADQRAAA